MRISDLQDNEKMMQILDRSVIIVFVGGCFLGKYCMSYNDIWLAFNGSVLKILVIGELVWWRVKKIILRKDNSDGKDS